MEADADGSSIRSHNVFKSTHIYLQYISKCYYFESRFSRRLIFSQTRGDDFCRVVSGTPRKMENVFRVHINLDANESLDVTSRPRRDRR